MAGVSPSSEGCSLDRRTAETGRREEGLVPIQERRPHSPPPAEYDKTPGILHHRTPDHPAYRDGDYVPHTYKMLLAIIKRSLQHLEPAETVPHTLYLGSVRAALP